MGCLSTFHFTLVANNWCTLEIGALYKNNVFSNQSWYQAMKVTFGSKWYYWLLPVNLDSDAGDGLDYGLQE